MEEILKSFGWNEIFRDTISRLKYFQSEFRTVFTEEEISDAELEKIICYTFGLYGQGHVFNIWATAKNELADKESLSTSIKHFIDAFKETIPDTAKNLTPKVYIELFIEYVFSLFIKGKS